MVVAQHSPYRYLRFGYWDPARVGAVTLSSAFHALTVDIGSWKSEDNCQNAERRKVEQQTFNEDVGTCETWTGERGEKIGPEGTWAW